MKGSFLLKDPLLHQSLLLLLLHSLMHILFSNFWALPKLGFRLSKRVKKVGIFSQNNREIFKSEIEEGIKRGKGKRPSKTRDKVEKREVGEKKWEKDMELGLVTLTQLFRLPWQKWVSVRDKEREGGGGAKFQRWGKRSVEIHFAENRARGSFTCNCRSLISNGSF